MKRVNSEPASMIRRSWLFAAGLAAVLALVAQSCRAPSRPPEFDGRHFSGRGDVEYLKLLDFSRRLFAPDPEFQNLAMLYQPAWNGLVEGPTWDAWWIQNSYGTAYGAMPFLEEPFVTFLQNAQALWFDQMGDGKRRGRPNDEVAPDGSLCDCAGPGWAIYKQGDGQTKIHDWGFEFAAAGIVMQAELLLIGRDAAAISRYLPMLERTADFIDSRRDPANNLFLVGAAANLLAPSYAGRLKPDGTYDKAYLAGLSITTIAALDRLIELEKLAGRADKARGILPPPRASSGAACRSFRRPRVISSSPSTPTARSTVCSARRAMAISRPRPTTTPSLSASSRTNRRGGSMPG